jgi:hypothetical protein
MLSDARRPHREGNEELSPSYLHRVFNAVIDEMRVRRRRSEVLLEPDEGGEVQETWQANPEDATRARDRRGIRVASPRSATIVAPR